MKIAAFLALPVLILACSGNTDKEKKSDEKDTTVVTENTNTEKMKTIYDYKVTDINGKEFDFASLKGKKIMIVNTASECGYTPQYEQMEALYKELGGDKFVLIGFPANNFGAQEPGTNEEIAGFCQKNFGVTFPMMAKVSVASEDKAEIYKFLTEKALNGKEDVEIKWNFQKFLIDENGNYVKTVGTKTLPNDPEIIAWIKG